MPSERKAFLKDAARFVTKWAPVFGFGHYVWSVTSIDDGADNTWAHVLFLHDDEWFEMRVAEGVMPVAQMEATVIHELTHGLISYAKQGDWAEETVCNRMARILTPDSPMPNVHFSERWWAADGKGSSVPALDPLVRKALPLVIDQLPEVERDVVNGLYWEQVSLRELARRLDVGKDTIWRIRDRALARLHVLLSELDEAVTDA